MSTVPSAAGMPEDAAVGSAHATHEEDNYGHQMVLMARSLQNEQSINDLMAYLSTL